MKKIFLFAICSLLFLSCSKFRIMGGNGTEIRVDKDVLYFTADGGTETVTKKRGGNWTLLYLIDELSDESVMPYDSPSCYNLTINGLKVSCFDNTLDVNVDPSAECHIWSIVVMNMTTFKTITVFQSR